jgi:hypothetical protein
VTRRLRALGLSGRRLRRGWTRERLAEVVRTLVYVVPLTLLIWVWAQDQQIDVRDKQNVPIRIEHLDGQKVVTVLRTASGEQVTRRGDSVLATLTLRGPRIGLNAVLRALNDDQRPTMFNLRIRDRAAEQTTISLEELLNEVDALRDAGVSVVQVTPSDLFISIEDRKQVDARIVANIDPDNLAGPVEFDPPSLMLTGPASAINELVGADGQVTLPANLPEDALPGDHEVNVTVRVPESLAGRVTPDTAFVTARYTLRERREETLELPFAVPVMAEVAAAWQGSIIAYEFDPVVLTALRVRGPADLIDALRRNDTRLRSQIRAVVQLERDDEGRIGGERITRQVEVQLPDGLVLEGEPPRVSFRVRRLDG